MSTPLSPETTSPSSPMSRTHKVIVAFESSTIHDHQHASNDGGSSTHATTQVSSYHHEPMAAIVLPPPTAAEMDLLRFNLLRQFPSTKITLKPTMHLRDGAYRHECQLKFYYLKPCASLNSYPSCRRFSEAKLLPSMVVSGGGDTRDAAEADAYRKALEMAHTASQYNDDDDDDSSMIRVKDCDKSGMWCTPDNTDNARELAVLACHPNTAMQIVMIRCVDETGQRPEKYRCDLYFAYAVRNPVQMHWTILSHAFIIQGRGTHASAWDAISAAGKQALEPFLPVTTQSEFEDAHDDSIAVKAPTPVLPPHILLSTHHHHHAISMECSQAYLSSVEKSSPHHHHRQQHSIHDTTTPPSRPPSTLPPTPQQTSHYYQSLGLGQSLPRSTQTFEPIATNSNEGVNISSPASHDEAAEHVDYISMLYQCKRVCGITFQMLDATGAPHAPTHRCQLTCGIFTASPTIQYRSVIAYGATIKEARHAAAKTMMTRYVLLLMAMNP